MHKQNKQNKTKQVRNTLELEQESESCFKKTKREINILND